MTRWTAQRTCDHERWDELWMDEERDGGPTWRVVTIVLPNLRGVHAALAMLGGGREGGDGVGGRQALPKCSATVSLRPLPLLLHLASTASTEVIRVIVRNWSYPAHSNGAKGSTASMGPPQALHAIPQELIDTLYFLLPPTSKAGLLGLGTDIGALVMGLRYVCLFSPHLHRSTDSTSLQNGALDRLCVPAISSSG